MYYMTQKCDKFRSCPLLPEFRAKESSVISVRYQHKEALDHLEEITKHEPISKQLQGNLILYTRGEQSFQL